MPTDPLALPAGSLRNEVTILQPTVFSDISGTATTYTSFLTVRAAINPMRGTDIVKSGQSTAETYIIVTIRYRDGITSGMRVQAEHGTFLIQSVENVLERNRVLKLLCLALGNNE